MWKAVIAEDERVILKGLHKLIDWEALGVEIVGDAYDGEQLKRLIEYQNPDIILSDIKMPYYTGLEVQQWYNENYSRAKFIFASGYEEFAFAKEAIRNGAIDYLLKPVGKKELEDAVKKAIEALTQKNTVDIFQEKKDDFQLLFEEINEGKSFVNEDLYRLFREVQIDVEDSFFVGVCVGIKPDLAGRMRNEAFAQFNLARFSVFNQVVENFKDKKLGFPLEKKQNYACLIGAFPKRNEEKYLEQYILPTIRHVEEICGVELCVGIGNKVYQIADLMSTYKESHEAFLLYHFEECKVIEYGDIHVDERVSFQDYRDAIDVAFKAILAKDSNTMDCVDHVMDIIRSIHYANWGAVRMRTMNFTGELSSKLDHYHMLPKDFYDMQDALQRDVEEIEVWSELKALVHRHYEGLIDDIYKSDRSKDKVIIEQVKQYIKDHYAEDLSIKELSDVACVSQNYFSAMFKKETGQNYKNYLTQIRMDKALELLRTTDYKTYEIGEQVGYNNTRRFVDAFKQSYSLSPMEYKKSLKE